MAKIFVLKGELTLELVKKYIELFKSTELPRLKKLKRYYSAKNDKIVNREFEDESKPNNKIAHAYAAYITDTLAAYMVGKAVSYNADDELLNESIDNIMNYNDSSDNDLEIAENQSIYGLAFELMYIDEDSEIRFKALDTLECIPIYDGTVERNLKYFIRFTEYQDPITLVTTTTAYVYDDKGVSVYSGDSIAGLAAKPIDVEDNIFGYIQINEYRNNNFNEGDFEKVISLIDAYDCMCSDTLNELDYFSDAYLLFTNCEIDTDSIQDMKNNKLIQAQSGDNGQAATVQWLTKNANDAEIENTKKRTVDEIHKLSKVPNLDPSAFVSHTTASHVFYSLLATEDLVAKKEKKFKKGLQQRLEKIVHVLNIKNVNGSYDYRTIEITFNRNVPQDLAQIADPISKLRDLVSDETLLSLIPGITNPKGELEKRNEQRIDTYGQLGGDGSDIEV